MKKGKTRENFTAAAMTFLCLCLLGGNLVQTGVAWAGVRGILSDTDTAAQEDRHFPEKKKTVKREKKKKKKPL